MTNEAEITPVDRPLMRSDLNEIRSIVWRISDRQIALQKWGTTVALICVTCAVLSFVCTVVSVRAMQTVTAALERKP